MWWHFMIGMFHLQAREQIRFFYNGAANISHGPKIQESPGGYVSASFIPANLSENDVRNAPDFSVLYIHRPATLLFRSEKFINLQISCNDQGRSPGHGI